MAAGRSRPSDPSPRTGPRARRGRGFVMFTKPLPRYVIAKTLASGRTAFYWNCPTYYRKQGCAIPNEPLGTDYNAACGADGDGGRAKSLNDLFDEWKVKRDGGQLPGIARVGTVDWLFREYKSSENYRERVSERTRPDYDLIMHMVAGLVTKKGDTIGTRRIRSMTPRAADKIYNLLCIGPRGPRLRQGEKVIAVCRHAWKVVHRLYPDLFDPGVPNPWVGVTKKRRVMATKASVGRELVYDFAWKAIEAGHPEPAAAAVICFEWLQRPENVLAGFISWTGYRSADAPTQLLIMHHKTGDKVLHPLHDVDGTAFYADAEAVLARLPQRGVPMILRPNGFPYTPHRMGQLVRRLADRFGLPRTFTLDACRHGGMTELEEAELTDGQGRAPSAHRSKAYEKYAKRTEKRALAATRK